MTRTDTAPRRGGVMRVARTRGMLSGLLLMVLGLWGALVPFIGPYFPYVLAGVSAVLVVWLVYKVVTTPSRMPVAAVPAPWGPMVSPGPLGPRATANGPR